MCLSGGFTPELTRYLALQPRQKNIFVDAPWLEILTGNNLLQLGKLVKSVRKVLQPHAAPSDTVTFVTLLVHMLHSIFPYF